MTKFQASELAGRLSWACNALFGRCRRAVLAPILGRPTNANPWCPLNSRLRRSLAGWTVWLRSPEEDLVTSAPFAPGSPCAPAVSYSNAGTDFGVGVISLPEEELGLWFAVPCPLGTPSTSWRSRPRPSRTLPSVPTCGTTAAQRS